MDNYVFLCVASLATASRSNPLKLHASRENIRKILDFLQKDRIKNILILAVPAALNSLLDMVNVLIDLLMVGKLSPEAIVAVGTGMQYLMLVYIFMSAFYVGTNAIVSRFIGAGETSEASRSLFNLSILALLISFPVALFFDWLNPHYYPWITDSVKAQMLGISYMEIILLSLPFMFLKIVFVSSLSASGNTKVPFLVKFVGIFLNIFLNYALIFGNFGFPRLEVDGAAIATLIVQVFEVVLLFIILKSDRYGITFERGLRLDLMKRAMRVGIPTSFERFFTFSAMLYLSKIISSYGVDALAGFQIGLRIEGLAFMPGIGFMIASMALVGQSLGAKNPDEGERNVLATLFVALLFMGSLGLLMIFIPESLASFFTDDPNTIKSAALYLFIIGFSQIPLAMLFVLDGALRGAGATKTTLFINVGSLWILRIIPCLLIAEFSLPLAFIFIVFSLETLFRGVLFWYFFKKGAWKSINV